MSKCRRQFGLCLTGVSVPSNCKAVNFVVSLLIVYTRTSCR